MTIVAAWMSADTGVGPAIASPSQDCSGNCADLPQAASRSRRPITVTVPSPAAATAVLTSPKSSVPKVASITDIARSSPTSPTRLTMKALLAAVA